MLNQHKFLILSLLFTIGLTVPYGVKLLSPHLEPYPAIIFPSGAGKVRQSQGKFEFRVNNIYCIDSSTKEWKRQDTSSFLFPIPPHYFSSIIKNEFGLNPDLKHTVKFRKNILPSFTYTNLSALDKESIDHTKEWIRERLLRHGCKDTYLLIRSTLMSADLKTKVVSEIEVIYEQLFKL